MEENIIQMALVLVLIYVRECLNKSAAKYTLKDQTY